MVDFVRVHIGDAKWDMPLGELTEESIQTISESLRKLLTGIKDGTIGY